MPVLRAFEKRLDAKRKVVHVACDRHAGSRGAVESKEGRIWNRAEFLLRICKRAGARHFYPTLSFVVQYQEVFGLIGIAVPASVVVERKGDMPVTVFANERKVIRDVDKRGGWHIIP